MNSPYFTKFHHIFDRLPIGQFLTFWTQIFYVGTVDPALSNGNNPLEPISYRFRSKKYLKITIAKTRTFFIKPVL